jgi:ABC-type multidrug transport system fused ATPase/permease subunit
MEISVCFAFSLYSLVVCAGSVYSAIFQALIDIRNLSELLFESPDIVDAPGATDIPVPARARGSSQSHAYDDAGDFQLTRIGGNRNNGAGSSTAGGGDNGASKGVSVEFRDVHFHYPEQPVEKGLRGVSIFIRPGTTTAIVGHTGAGEERSLLLLGFFL